MLKNNFIVVLLHLVVNVFVFFVYGTPSSFPKFGFLGEILFFLITLLIYVVIGYLFTGNLLKYQKNKFSNLFSVSLIFILGLLVWAYKFFADIFWIFGFYVYNYYAIPLYPIFEHFHFNNLFDLVDLEVLFSLFPVLLIWVGMELKYKNNTKRS